TFWKNLIAGKSAVDYITAFDPSPFPCKVAAEVRDFRPQDFMHARTVKITGRFSQFAIAATRLALEDAGLTITRDLASKVGVAYGTSGGADVFEAAAREFLQGGVGAIRPWAALEYPPHTPSSYVAIEFKAHGPAISLTSNCCTGIDAIDLAARQIALGKVDVAIAGSTDGPISPVAFGTFCALGALSTRPCQPSAASRPYDLLRDGLVISEAGATLILEHRDFALARGAHIYGEFLGYGAVSEAMGMRKGDLSGGVMATALSVALTDAHLTPSDIDHINAHGSSLQDFDVCDSNAFKLALGRRAHSVPISSIKSMIGQPFSAAGTLQAVAACLSIRDQQVPPTINQEFADPACDLDYVPNISRRARVRNVLLNGHSFGGSCSALILGAFRE
ncbi:MAG: beta-ketoacyl-[acyl-carrier-protein] synthase family protein, partial [Longimicrobiales bacterium]